MTQTGSGASTSQSHVEHCNVSTERSKRSSVAASRATNQATRGFAAQTRYTTIEINDIRLNHVRTYDTVTLVRIKGLPTIRLRPDRELPACKPRSIRIVRRMRGCTVDIVYEHTPERPDATGASVGIDVGVRKRLTLSTGETIPPERENWERIRRLQRAAARCRPGSVRRRKRVRRLAAIRRRHHVRSRNACHRITTNLVRRFDMIAVERLAIGNMTCSARGEAGAPGRNVRAKRMLNRSILEQQWGQIRRQLACKAAWAGRRLIEVDPRCTSQECSKCRRRRTKPDGKERWRCEYCRTEHDRDVNASVNIHRAGIIALGSRSGERVAA